VREAVMRARRSSIQGALETNALARASEPAFAVLVGSWQGDVMTEGPGHPRGSAKARAAFYREKAAALRKRAVSSWDVTRATLIQAAQIYEGIAASIEEAWHESPPPSDKSTS
jgi:hypothetical protein